MKSVRLNNERMGHDMGSARVNFLKWFSSIILLFLLAVTTWGKDAQTVSANLNKASQLRYAVLVGIEDYDDSTIIPLKGPNKDVCALRKALISAGGFQEDKVIVFAKPDSCKNIRSFSPTKVELFAKLRSFVSKIPPDSFLLFAFSGHGVAQGSESYLMLQDSSIDEHKSPVQAIKVSDLWNLLTLHGNPLSHLMLLLDACRNTVNKDIPDFAGAPLDKRFDESINLAGKTGRVRSASIFFSASPGQKSFIRSFEPVSFFTWAVIRGLIGEAADAEGKIKVGTLAQYIEKEVPELVRFDFRSNKETKQAPVTQFFGSNPKDFVISTVSLPSNRFFYTVEALIRPKTSAGYFSIQHQDLVSPRPAGFIDETLPLNASVIEAPLEVIKIPYIKDNVTEDAQWHYLVRMTFHHRRFHRAFILCPSSPQVPEKSSDPEIKTYIPDPEIKTYILDGHLIIDALVAFRLWGRVLSDDYDIDPVEYKTFPSSCLPR